MTTAADLETTRNRLKRSAKGIALLAASALVIASCGDDDTTSTTDTGAVSEEAITIEGAWARTSPMSVSVGAVYMNITAAADDELVGASVDAAIAGTVEIHETVPVDMPGEEGEDSSMSSDTMAGDMGDMSSDTMAGDMGDMSGMSGEMTMQPVSAIVLPAGEMVMLMPGGYHIMLLDLVAPLEVGQTFDITLTFANAGTKVVTVEVRDEAP